jgi:predicted ATP-dependent endonuclease of OLD family
LWNIEEPETFLHPTAQRRLSALLRTQAKNTQILTTTHSPLFVDRRAPQSNVLVQREKKDGHYSTVLVKLPREDPLKPVRKSLGTSLADSLSLHEAVIVVEGVSDVTIFTEAFRRLCGRQVVKLDSDYVAFVSGHGASHQATALNILRSWSPLGRAVAIFDYDKAGRDDGARRLKGAHEGEDYFFLPHSSDDVVLEDLYSASIHTKAETDGSVVRTITTTQRPDGQQLSRNVEWNKDQLAQFFVKNADDAEWSAIEDFIADVVRKVVP